MKSYMSYRPSQLAFTIVMAKLIFVSDEIRAKLPQKPNFEKKKIRILGEYGINFKLKHRKAHNSILSGRFGDPYGRPGDCCRIRESLHVYTVSSSFRDTASKWQGILQLLPTRKSLVHSLIDAYETHFGPHFLLHRSKLFTLLIDSTCIVHTVSFSSQVQSVSK